MCTMIQKEITVLSFTPYAASTHITVWREKNKTNKKNVCVRSLTSTSWWSSDPWLAAELVSVVFAWLRLERRSPARLTGVKRRREEEEVEEEVEDGGDLDWLSNTKR